MVGLNRLLESQPYPKILFQRSEYFLDRDRIVVGFTTTSANSVYHHKSCEFESRSWRSVLDTTLSDNVCQ